jgi:hypothetical protein
MMLQSTQNIAHRTYKAHEMKLIELIQFRCSYKAHKDVAHRTYRAHKMEPMEPMKWNSQSSQNPDIATKPIKCSP